MNKRNSIFRRKPTNKTTTTNKQKQQQKTTHETAKYELIYLDTKIGTTHSSANTHALCMPASNSPNYPQGHQCLHKQGTTSNQTNKNTSDAL